MLSNKSSSKDNVITAYDLKKAAKRRRRIIRDIIFGLILVGALVGIGTCVQCIGRKADVVIERTVSDVSDFSVVFNNGKATLSWGDAPDIFLTHLEVQYGPNSSKEPETIAPRMEKYVISGLENGKEYSFTVKAVDKWGNKSETTEGGIGKAYKQQSPGNPIRGTPIAKQVTLSWTNPADSEYDHLEISYTPNHEKPIWIPRGVGSKTLTNLTNGTEYTFNIVAVDAKGNRKYLDEIGIFIPYYATSPEAIVGRPSGGEVALAWQEAYNAPIDRIEIVYSPEGEAPITITKGAGTETITGLSDVTDYEFVVYAVNTDGHRQPIRNVKLLTPAVPSFDGRDVEKFEVRAQPVAGQVKFQWDDPDMANLDHIAIIYEPDDIDVPVIVEKGTGTTTVVGLADNREYRFMLYGVDTENNNRVISGVKFSTPRLPILRVKPVAGKATLVWSNPDDPRLDHVSLICSPGRETPLPVAKRVEAYTFTNLSDSQEYEFNITALNAKGNVYGVARANVIVAKLPVLTGAPMGTRLSLAWTDPEDEKIDHIEIVSSPGEKVQTVAKGMESYTFTNLESNTEYAFTVYGLDNAGNRHPVKSAKIYDPNAVFAVHSDSTFQTGKLGQLNWKSTGNTTFADSTVSTLSFGIAVNGTPRWVAGGGEGRMAYSNDYGLNWIQVPDSTFGSFPINTICYGNGRWIAAGKSGRIAWSTNAITWNAVKKTHFSNSQAINALAFGNDHWIAGGTNGTMIVSDDDGVTWRLISTTVFGKSAINTIVFHEGRWMAGGAGGKIAYSDDDGATWTLVEKSTFGSSAINIIVYDWDRWMAGGYAQTTAYSEDGITWQSLPRPFYILCMGFSGNRWVVGGQEGRLAWSSDGGKNWIIDEQGHNLFGSDWVQAIAVGRSSSGKRRWLSGGQNGKIIYADE